MNIRLFENRSQQRDKNFKLDDDPVILGRSKDASFCLDDPWVSRRHCEIVESDGQVILRDLSATHGTYVNGTRVSQKALAAGDEIQLGLTTITVRFEQGEAGAQVLDQRLDMTV